MTTEKITPGWCRICQAWHPVQDMVTYCIKNKGENDG